MHLEAGWGIKAGSVIAAAGAIRCRRRPWRARAIRAGTGYGVFAGLDVQMEWPGEASARVTAAAPEGLMSGWWAASPC